MGKKLKDWVKGWPDGAWVGLGVVLLLASAGLHAWELLQLEPQGVVWPTLVVLIATPLGVFTLVAPSLKKYSKEGGKEIDYAEVRREGFSGVSKVSKQWMKAQTRRSYQITCIAITVIALALAFYAKNHVTGKLYPSLEAGEEKVHWQTHDERLKAGSVHKGKKGEMLASIAVSQGISLTALAEANPAAELEFKEVMTSTLATDKALGPDETITIQGAAQKLGTSTSDVAVGFAAAPLSKDQNLTTPKEPVVDYRQWLDWWLWALIGVSAYLLIEDARYYREIPTGRADFLGETLWYWAQFLTGPVIAFIILLVFTQIDVSLLGETISINTTKFIPDLLFVPAFLLGFYSRVARHVLNNIMKSAFRSAWLAAHGEFEIVFQGREDPDDTAVESSGAVVFKSRPATDVSWHTSDGNIAVTGAYTAPQVDQVKDVVITAVASRGAGIASKIVQVVPKLEVEAWVGDTRIEKEGKVAQGSKVTLKATRHTLSNEEAARIEWSTSAKAEDFVLAPDAKGASVDGEVPQGATVGTSIPVSADYRGLQVTFTFKVGAPPSPEPSPKLEKSGVTKKTQDGQEVKEWDGKTAAPGEQVTFTVVATNLSEEEVAKIEWKVTAGETDFEWIESKGTEAVGKVTEGAKAGNSITVTAEYPDVEPVPFTFQVG